MEISRDLEKEVVNNLSAIKSVDVTYLDGETVSGFVTKAQLMPFVVTLCKHETKRGENSQHYLDFDNAAEITLIYHNKESKTFN